MNEHYPPQSRTSSQAHRRSRLLLAIALIAYASATLWAAEVYRYVDAQGHVVYSDQAVPDTSAAPTPAVAAVGSAGDAEVRSNDAPPPLPDNQQPPCPQDGYLWTPGYWAWGPGGYYWVPGSWVQPPRVGVLWTPAYWGYVGDIYLFHPGYWAPHIGYYGGINYGFGYSGVGFVGGHWERGAFAYNRSVSNVDEHLFHHTYNEAVQNSARLNRVSYNGGPGGIQASPTAQERAFAAEPRLPATAWQRQNTMQAVKLPVLMPHTVVKIDPAPPTPDHHGVGPVQKPAVHSTSAVAAARSIAAPPALSEPKPPRAVPAPRAPVAVAPATRPTTPPRPTPMRSMPTTK
jgi:hypothetical protein